MVEKKLHYKVYQDVENLDGAFFVVSEGELDGIIKGEVEACIDMEWRCLSSFL